MLRFDVNVSMLWRDLPFVARLEKAAAAGFDTVEFLWPRGEDLDAIARAIQGLRLGVALHNMDGGDMPRGDRGYANDPARRGEWREKFQEAVAFAQRVGCLRVNCLVGNDSGTSPREEQLAVVVENFQWALPLAADAGIILLIEPLNLFESPRYLLGHTSEALGVMRRLASDDVRLQYDVYHMQRMEDRVAETIRQNVHEIGHIQIADTPGSHEPGTGEIDWREVFGAIEDSGYNGFVGLEYVPSTTADDSLRWMPHGKRREWNASELNL
jgi:hydroxypyruvate isomerase